MDIRRYNRITFWIVLVLGVLFALSGGNYASAAPPCIPFIQDCPGDANPNEPGVLANDPPGRVNYVATPDSISIVNPERGFYRHPPCNVPPINTDSDPTKIEDDDFEDEIDNYRNDDPDPNANADSYSLLICVYYLTKQPSDSEAFQNQLADLQAKAELVKAAGLKMILRFAYTANDVEDDDVPLARIEEHIDALASTLQEHSDVIAIVQSGFIGAWGEGSGSDFFPEPEVDLTGRWVVVRKLLEVMPSSRTVQARRPWWKRDFAQFNDHDETADARIGHHNDCFLRNELDAGTYKDPDLEKPYLERDTRVVPMGGETCPPPEGQSLPIRAACGDGRRDDNPDPKAEALDDEFQLPNADETNQRGGDALEELERFHYSYLNWDWSRIVLDTWGECVETVRNKLGYRLSLVWSEVPESFFNADIGMTDITVRIRIKNTGWAAPFNPRRVYLVFRNTESNEEFKLPFDEDLRQWVPGTGEGPDYNFFTLEKRFQFEDPWLQEPNQDNAYELFLSLPDPMLEDIPAFYSIQLANVDDNNESLWDPETGYNNLLRVETAEYIEP